MTGKVNTENWHQRSRLINVTVPDHVVQKALGIISRKKKKKLERFGDVDDRSLRMLQVELIGNSV